jgi:hypothetical protein
MKTKLFAALALGVTVLGTPAAGAGAKPRVVTIDADLTLKPGVAHH